MSALPSEDLLVRVAGSGVENLDVTISRERTVRDLKEIVEQRAGPAACSPATREGPRRRALVAAGLQPRTKLCTAERAVRRARAAVVSSRMKLRPSSSLSRYTREARRRPHRRGRAGIDELRRRRRARGAAAGRALGASRTALDPPLSHPLSRSDEAEPSTTPPPPAHPARSRPAPLA